METAVFGCVLDGLLLGDVVVEEGFDVFDVVRRIRELTVDHVRIARNDFLSHFVLVELVERVGIFLLLVKV